MSGSSGTRQRLDISAKASRSSERDYIGDQSQGALFRTVPDLSIRIARVHFGYTPVWSAPAERSSDGAFVDLVRSAESKAVSRFACRRTPYTLQSTRLVLHPRCDRIALPALLRPVFDPVAI